MDKIIQDIVEIDFKYSQRVEEAKRKRQDIQSHMSAKKKEIYDSFVKEYQVKIDAHKKELEAQIQDTKMTNEQEYKESLNQLSNLYDQHKDEWVSGIVNRCKEI